MQNNVSYFQTFYSQKFSPLQLTNYFSFYFLNLLNNILNLYNVNLHPYFFIIIIYKVIFYCLFIFIKSLFYIEWNIIVCLSLYPFLFVYYTCPPLKKCIHNTFAYIVQALLLFVVLDEILLENHGK